MKVKDVLKVIQGSVELYDKHTQVYLKGRSDSLLAALGTEVLDQNIVRIYADYHTIYIDYDSEVQSI